MDFEMLYIVDKLDLIVINLNFTLLQRIEVALYSSFIATGIYIN